ncbi:MAG: ABC transporter ATP-binding protein [Dongiaceae bacterium]
MNERAMPVLSLERIKRGFDQAGGKRLEVIRDATLIINRGEMVALVGPSGSGKSTLLQIAGLLEQPDSGTIRIGDAEAVKLGDGGRTALRLSHIGFVYQYHHLLPEFSALENVAVPQMIARVGKRTAAERARELLGHVGLAERTDHRPGQLSGGEQQRVAIARALANRPQLLLADEPTGNLDPHTADEVFALLIRLVRDFGLAALIATHNPGLAQRMDRRLTIVEGRVREV